MSQSHVFVAVASLFGDAKLSGRTGIFRAVAGESEWQHVLPDREAYTVLVDPRDASRVFAGTNDGVYRSTDGGATFVRTGFPDSGIQVWSLLIDATNPRRMLAGGSPTSIYRSHDGGATWTRRPAPRVPEHAKAPFPCRVMRLAAHPERPDEIYAAREIAGVMRSTDGGETWVDCSAGLFHLAESVPRLRSKLVCDTEAEGMLDGHAILTSAADPSSVMLAVRMGLFRSTDQGRTWTDLEIGRTSPFTYGRDVRVAPTDPSTIYACLSVAAMSQNGALYRSTDCGRSWSRFDKVQPHGTLMSVSPHPTDARQVYVAARYGEVFGTRDGGETWMSMPLPADVQHTYAIACG